MQKNALSNQLTAAAASISKRNKFQRIIIQLVSSFLRSGICVTHAHHHHNHHRHRHNLNHNHHHRSRMQRDSLNTLYTLLMLATLLIIRLPSECHAVGYSYARFVGPVSGPEREILVSDEINGGSRVDYIAHPEYEFSYGVEDSETQNLQNRKETRNGNEVKGVYSVVEPDGTLRVVKYTADNLNGFQAEVITNGVTTTHGQNDDETIKDNGNANWHVQTGNKNDDDTRNIEGENENENENENDYEVYEQYDENSEDQSKNNDSDSAEADDSDDHDTDLHDTEYDDETQSEETNDADVYSDESNEY